MILQYKRRRRCGLNRRRTEQEGCSKLTLAQCPRASLSPQRVDSPVLFIRDDQRPSSGSSRMVSFADSEGDCDDSMSLMQRTGQTPVTTLPTQDLERLTSETSAGLRAHPRLHQGCN